MPVTTPATTREPDLAAAFRAARYRVETDEGVCEVRIGRRHPRIDRIAARNRWCIITAHNPAVRRVAESTNQRADAALHRLLRQRDPQALLRSVNHDPGGRWPDEPGWWFTFDRDSEVDGLANAFGQAAIVVGEPGRAARLKFYVDAATRDRNHPSE